MFEKDVTINAVLYIIEKIGGKVDMHKIFKILYFADQEHLSKYGRTITRDVYIAMSYGPVPSKTDDIFKAVRGDSYFQAGDLGKYFHFINKMMVVNDEKPNLDYLSESDILCLDHAIAKCKAINFNEWIESSHGYAWKSTAQSKRMSFSDILAEVGDTDEYAQYVENSLMLESSYR